VKTPNNLEQEYLHQTGRVKEGQQKQRLAMAHRR
jgi:hypothetical protein